MIKIVTIRFLEIDKNAWTGLEETAGSSPATHHIGAVRFSVYLTSNYSEKLRKSTYVFHCFPVLLYDKTVVGRGISNMQFRGFHTCKHGVACCLGC